MSFVGSRSRPARQSASLGKSLIERLLAPDELFAHRHRLGSPGLPEADGRDGRPAGTRFRLAEFSLRYAMTTST